MKKSVEISGRSKVNVGCSPMHFTSEDFNEAVPKRILKLMNVPGLTRENVASHLQLPLLRWKTKPDLAALCMVGASGLTIQLSVLYHIQKYVLGGPIVLTKSLGFSVILFSLFAAVLAMFKDIPDVDGDQEFGNRTFSVRHGKKKVFTFCITILLFAYGSAALIGASSSILLNKLVSVIGHCTLASFLLLRANSLDLNDNASVQSFYMFLWKLFNADLARALFGRDEQRLNLDWPTRKKILLEIAKGLTYLHEESRLKIIVHRDIKATNVLLDRDFNAKISDLGLAKLDEEENTHISTRIAGTVYAFFMFGQA